MLNRIVTQYDTGWFIDLYKSVKLYFSIEERHNTLWTDEDKYEWITTVMLNYPSAPIYITKKYDGTDDIFLVMDGCQRIKTLIDYVHGDIRLPENYIKGDYWNLHVNGKTWSEITNHQVKHNFLNYSFCVHRIFGDITAAEWGCIFSKLNRKSRT